MTATRLRLLAIPIAAVACSDDKPNGPCPELFGIPNENTGLNAAICSPDCPCEDVAIELNEFDQASLDRLAASVLVNPPDVLTADPYDEPVPDPPAAGTVCAVIPEPGTPNGYRTQTLGNLDEVPEAILTHTGACGMCSSLADLAVYAGNGDLTAPVRRCAGMLLGGGRDAVLDCLRELGFTEPCAHIWYYNSVNTREHCLVECLEALEEPYHLPDGALNPCLQCDEDNSGPVFKAISGRTRRNSGLATAICRPCETVSSVRHDYSAIIGP